MDKLAVPYRKIVFVCANRRDAPEACCAEGGGEAIAAALKDRITALKLTRLIRVSKSGCHDVCAQGPSVMVFPDNVWYRGVTQDDIERIVRDTVAGVSGA